MSLVEHDQIVGSYTRFREARKHPCSGQRVYAYDNSVAVLSHEWIVVAGITATDDLEPKAKQSGKFAPPVANQSSRRHDQHAAQQSARERLPDVEPRHDCLAGTGIIGKQIAESNLLEHVVVDSDPLVRERVDLRDLRGEDRIGHVPKRESLPLCQGTHDFWTSREIEHGGFSATLADSVRLDG